MQFFTLLPATGLKSTSCKVLIFLVPKNVTKSSSKAKLLVTLKSHYLFNSESINLSRLVLLNLVNRRRQL